MIARLEESGDGEYEMHEIKKWKGTHMGLLLNDSNCPLELQGEQDYLIYAFQVSDYPDRYITNACTRTKSVPDSKEDTTILNFIAPCIDSSIINPNAICPRNLDPVIGCDGKTYGNPCEASQNGVLSWTRRYKYR